MGHVGRLRAFLYVVVVMGSVAGCAVGRSVVNVDAPVANSPGGTQKVAIVEVRDLRPFAVYPGIPERPSAQIGTLVEENELKERIVGRKRNSYGMRMGEVLLPQGTSVAGLVHDAAATALREKGYEVVTELGPDTQPVSIDVEQFWAWFTPGVMTVSVDFESRLLIRGAPVIGHEPATVRGQAQVSTFAASDSTWAQAIREGLDSLVRSMEHELASPAVPQNARAISVP